MTDFLFDYTHVQIDSERIKFHLSRLTSLTQMMKSVLSSDQESPYQALRLPSDEHLYNRVHHAVNHKKKLHPSIIVLIGIGGSNLGTQAVMTACMPDAPIMWLDTIDPYMLDQQRSILDALLHAGKEIMLIVVSKSGTTLETMLNFQICLSLLKHHRPKTYEQYIVTITDRGSSLWQLAQEYGFEILEIPQAIVGRFSVFSAVGLFPLAFMGVDIDQLRAGAQSMLGRTLYDALEYDGAALMACAIYEHYLQGRSIHDLFVFSPRLHAFGLWYRQLMAESLAKIHDRRGALIHSGIVPTVSIGTTDLHSMVQLYLAGPPLINTTFISFQELPMITIESLPGFHLLSQLPTHQHVGAIMSAILQGTLRAYEQQNRPYMHIRMSRLDAYALGQLLQLCMLQVMYLGELLNVNTFDQPEVELYKKQTYRILSNG